MSQKQISEIKRPSERQTEFLTIKSKKSILFSILQLASISFAVKEQCIVLFPYNAVNDDELTLEEGQLINIVSKDVEDKGWWKGEIDGKVGVFPVSESVTRWSI